MWSETQAQKTRPPPLKIEIRPTMPAAAIGVMPTISWAIGEAWLMIMIPAETFRNNMSHNSQISHGFLDGVVHSACSFRHGRARLPSSWAVALWWISVELGCENDENQVHQAQCKESDRHTAGLDDTRGDWTHHQRAGAISREATPVINPRLSGNHFTKVATGVMYPMPMPIPVRTP